MQTQRPSYIYISHQDSHTSYYSKMNLGQIQAHDGICALSHEKHQIRVIFLLEDSWYYLQHKKPIGDFPD